LHEPVAAGGALAGAGALVGADVVAVVAAFDALLDEAVAARGELAV
jgi:hypothetical protein